MDGLIDRRMMDGRRWMEDEWMNVKTDGCKDG